MRSVGPLGVLSVLCLFGSQQSQAQFAMCDGESTCMADGSSPAASKPDRSLVVAKLADQTGSERCLGAPVVAEATSPDERHLVCSAANDAVQLLGRCGILLRRPLHVQIMGEVRHPFGGVIFGLFDPKRETVLVTHETNVQSLIKDTPYARLPERDFYKSLIVHEVIHGVMHQNLKRRPTSQAEYEYPAYALQIESLAPLVRDQFFQSFDEATIGTNFLFNDPVLLFDPYHFAARAHRHFKASVDGCTHLTALLESEVAFIAPPM